MNDSTWLFLISWGLFTITFSGVLIGIFSVIFSKGNRNRFSIELQPQNEELKRLVVLEENKNIKDLSTNFPYMKDKK